MSRESRTSTADHLAKAGTAVGFLSLVVAVVLAHNDPTTGYELSLYGATPVGFWIGVFVALSISVIVSFWFRGKVRLAALLLAGLAVASTAFLPLFRGYLFYGAADGLTHVGWTKDLIADQLSPFSMFYPALHTSVIFSAEVLGIELTRAWLFLIALLAVVTFVFVPLSVRSIATRPRAVTVGVFSGLLLLPINQVATHYITPHTFSESTLFLPVGLFLLFRYLTNSRKGYYVSAMGLLLAVFSTALVLIHPLQSNHLFLIFSTVIIIQFLYRRYRPDHRIAHHRALYFQTLLVGVLFTVWAGGRRATTRTAQTFLQGFIEFITGTGGGAAVVQQRTGSLVALGGSPVVLFLKLFLPSAIFCVLVGILVFGNVIGRTDDGVSDVDAIVKYLGLSLVLLIPMGFLLLIAGDTSKLFFRVFGTVMVVVTIVGTFALFHINRLFPRNITLPFSVRRVVVVVFVLFLLVQSLAVFFTSPYIYKPNRQVTEHRMSGFETAFENQDRSIELVANRQEDWRFYHAIYGAEGDSDFWWEMKRSPWWPEDRWGNLQRAYSEPKYIAITDSAVVRETVVLGELRYSREGFESIRARPGNHHIQANGGFDLYLLPGDAG